MSSTLDAYQVVTLLFGLVVLWRVMVEYKGSTFSGKWSHFNDVLSQGLPLLFVAYAVIVTGAAGTRNADMYKNLIFVLGIGSVLLSSLHSWVADSSPHEGAKWSSVAQNSSFGLATGALFAVPVAYFSFK